MYQPLRHTISASLRYTELCLTIFYDEVLGVNQCVPCTCTMCKYTCTQSLSGSIVVEV